MQLAVMGSIGRAYAALVVVVCLLNLMNTLCAGSRPKRDPVEELKIQQVPLEGGGRRFDVTFPGQAAIQVADPTDAELALYANAGANGIWITVLEKAYCQRLNDRWRTFNVLTARSRKFRLKVAVGFQVWLSRRGEILRKRHW